MDPKTPKHDISVSNTAFDNSPDESQYALPEVGDVEPVNKAFLGRLNDWAKLPVPEGTAAPGRWSNADLEPTPRDQQTWRSYNFVTYWLCDAVAPGNLRLGSSLVTLGLSWRAAIGVIALGHFLISLAITANGIVGARLHIPYTVQARASFGFFFSFFVVFVRMLVGFFWYGINTYNGALCVNAVLIAIWPSFKDLPNSLPESANITTQMMTSYVVYFLITLPFHYIHPRKLRWFFNMKVILCIPGMFGMLGWACHEAGGGMNSSLISSGRTVYGSPYAWAFMSGLNSMLGNYGTMAVNINDFARYASRTRMVFVQIIVVPLSFALIAFIGVIIAGAASDKYGEEVWDPLTILSYWGGSSGARAAAAFIGLSFVLAQLGSNISANCISASNDLVAMFPEYVNLRRGSFIIAFIGAWALTPWNILASASALLNFMDGYTIWLAPITGILLADYYFVHNQHYVVEEMYQPNGRYRFNKYGTNWRAVVAWFVGWVPLTPGFATAVTPSLSVTNGAMNLYHLSYVYGFFTSTIVYVAFSRLLPMRELAIDDTPDYPYPMSDREKREEEGTV